MSSTKFVDVEHSSEAWDQKTAVASSQNDATEHFGTTEHDGTTEQVGADNVPWDTLAFVRVAVACVGIVTNLLVIVAFTRSRRLRRKPPNMFIINQVRDKTVD